MSSTNSSSGRTRGKTLYASTQAVIESKFRARLDKFFGPYVDMKSPARSVEWACISLAWPQFCVDGRLFEDNVRSKLYFDFIFNLLEEFRCVDESAIDSALDQYEAYRNKNYCNLRYLFFTARPFRFSVPLPQFAIVMKDSCYPVFRAFLLRDVDAVRRLIRYGELCDLASVAGDYITKYLDYILDCLLDIPFDPYISYPTDYHARNRSVIRCSGRLIFLIMLTDTLIQMRDGERNHRDTIRSFMWIFKATTQPYITIAEIQRFLRLYVKKPDRSVVDEERVQEFCDLFLKLHPRGRSPPQPRSLKHLSRVRVRDSLNAARKLPHGVWALDLPKELKNYVVFQRTEDDFRPPEGFWSFQ